MNVSGVVVKVLPEYLEDVKNTLIQSGLCEVHFVDEKGLIVVTIEGESSDDEISSLAKLQTLPHIISADMVYTYNENEVEKRMMAIDKGELVLNTLNSDKKAQEIRYGGDVRNFVDYPKS